MHPLFELSGVTPPSVLEKDASFIGSFRAQTVVDRAGAALGRGVDRATSRVARPTAPKPSTGAPAAAPANTPPAAPAAPKPAQPPPSPYSPPGQMYDAPVGPENRTRMQRASDWAWNNPKSTAALMGLGGVAVPAAGYGAYQGLKEDPWYTQAFNRITGR